MKKISNNISNSFVEKAVALVIVAIFIGGAFVPAAGSQSKNLQDVVSSERVGIGIEEYLDSQVLSSSTDSSNYGGSSILNVFIDTLLGVVNFVVNNAIVNGLREMFTEEETKEEIDGDTYQIMTNQIIGFGNEESQQKSGITIDVWYGLNQKYGHIGIPQDWVNILGEVSSDVNSLVYSLNGAPNVTLTIGPDGRRLVNAGDFNIDIAHVDLVEGINEVVITANNSTSTLTETVNINYTSGNIWPLPYSVNWSNVSNINDVAHVVDGKWSIINDTVRTIEPGYDRLIAIGDVTWTDYEVVVPVRFNSGGGGTGILMRWHGHTDNPVSGTQPKSGWLPLGAIGWYYNNGLEIYGNNAEILARDTGITLSNGVTYIFKMRVETIGGVGGLYSLKVWEQGTEEPLAWDLTGQETLSDPQDGSMMLISHQRDVSFGEVNITPIEPNIINNISVIVTNVTANVTWTTDEEANSSVAYGLTASYELGVVNSSALVTDHLIELTGLLPSTTYHYQIISFTANGTMYNSRDYTFTTLGPDISGILSDDFNDCYLYTPLWDFIDPLADSDYSMDGERILIHVPAGTSHDPWTGGNIAPRLMQGANNSNFEFVVKYESNISEGYQLQGIFIEQDSNNYIRFDFHHDGTNAKTFTATFTGGSPSTLQNEIIASGNAPMYMKIKREGDTWTKYISYDGLSWNESLVFDHSMNVNEVGVFGANAGTSPPEHIAIIDYLFNTDSPIDPEDADSNSLTLNIFGNGSVSKNPDKADYGCEEVQLIATPDPDWNFFEWSGDLTGDSNPIMIFVDGDKVVNATFLEGNDTTPPIISNIQENLTQSTAQITWDTNELANSSVSYGLTTGYEIGVINGTNLVIQHMINLTGLNQSTLYHYEITSIDTSGNSASSGDRTFTTLAPDPSEIESDHFNYYVLDPMWTFVDPLNDSSMTLNGTHLNISVPAGTEHQLWTSGIETPRIMQSANDVDFEIEVKIDSGMNSQYQEQGIVIEQDEFNFLRFEFFSTNSNTYIFAAILSGSSYPLSSSIEINTQIAGIDTAPLYMNVRRVGDLWTQEYSFDNVNWNNAGSFTHALIVNQVGVYGGNAVGGGSPAHVAEFDYFLNAAEPPMISNVLATPSSTTQGGYVNITCDVIDDVGVDTVKVNITGPIGFTPVNTIMNEGSYYYNESYSIPGMYSYYIWANDTSNNSNTSAQYTFLIVNLSEYSTISLRQNWNLISLSVIQKINKTDIIVSYNDQNLTWNDAVVQGIILNFIYNWSRSSQTYITSNTFEPGYGYWVWAYHDCTLLVNGSYSNNENITHLLQRWNLIGQTEDTPIWKNYLFIHYNVTGYTWYEATTNNNEEGEPLILNFIYGWGAVNQNYEIVEMLLPGESYWMYAYYNCTLLRA